jgi:hypothetical protein
VETLPSPPGLQFQLSGHLDRRKKIYQYTGAQGTIGDMLTNLLTTALRCPVVIVRK